MVAETSLSRVVLVFHEFTKVVCQELRGNAKDQIHGGGKKGLTLADNLNWRQGVRCQFSNLWMLTLHTTNPRL